MEYLDKRQQMNAAPIKKQPVKKQPCTREDNMQLPGSPAILHKLAACKPPLIPLGKKKVQ